MRGEARFKGKGWGVLALDLRHDSIREEEKKIFQHTALKNKVKMNSQL